MSNIIDRIHDDYDDYVKLCKDLNIKPKFLGGASNFYDHAKELELIKNNMREIEEMQEQFFEFLSEIESKM